MEIYQIHGMKECCYGMESWKYGIERVGGYGKWKLPVPYDAILMPRCSGPYTVYARLSCEQYFLNETHSIKCNTCVKSIAKTTLSGFLALNIVFLISQTVIGAIRKEILSSI